MRSPPTLVPMPMDAEAQQHDPDGDDGVADASLAVGEGDT